MHALARPIVALYGISNGILATSIKEAYHIGSIGAIRKEHGRKAISELVTGQ